MTFDEILTRVKGRLNLTSTDATTRIGEFINERYKRATSSIGLEPIRIGKSDVALTLAGTPGLPEVTTTDYNKILKIQLVVGTTITTLNELTYNGLTNLTTNSSTPSAWAVKSLGAHSVTYVLDAYPGATAFTLRLQGYTRLTDISGSTEPVFPEDFHDILIHGAMADELNKMEKDKLAEKREEMFEARLSDLRMFISKSIMLDIAQGLEQTTWYRPSYARMNWNN